MATDLPARPHAHPSPRSLPPGVALVPLPAEVDVLTIDEVRDAMLASLNRGGVNLLVDASATTFLDSSGINALVRARERALRLGGSLHVVTTSPPVLRVLEVTGLQRILAVVPTVTAALACITSGAFGHTCVASTAHDGAH